MGLTPRLIRGLVVLLALCAASRATACKYTVRDVGFVDLGAAPYHLFLTQTTGGDGHAIDEKSIGEFHAALDDSNIEGHLLTGAADASPEADAGMLASVRQFLENQPSAEAPRGVLVAPDGRLRLVEPVSVDAPARSIADVAAMSPLRRRLLEDLLAAHSVVLLVEGTDAEQNAAARAVAEESIEHIASGLKSLPKHISEPPRLVVVSRDEAADERVLLWSLGIPGEEPDSAHLAALFGRLRMMGTVLAVPGATARDLSSFLFYVGQDCECELDRSAMQGQMAPHAWDGPLEADAAKALGFDPGHAVVKVEMSRILARGFSSGQPTVGANGPSTFARPGASGYEEIEIEILSDDDETESSSASVAVAETVRDGAGEEDKPKEAASSGDETEPNPMASVDASASTGERVADAESPPQQRLPSPVTWWILGGAAIATVLVSGAVVAIARGGR